MTNFERDESVHSLERVSLALSFDLFQRNRRSLPLRARRVTRKSTFAGALSPRPRALLAQPLPHLAVCALARAVGSGRPSPRAPPRV